MSNKLIFIVIVIVIVIGKTLSNLEEIANAFNVYFANIGEKLASEIGENINNNADYTNYISMLPSVETRFQFNYITDNDT